MKPKTHLLPVIVLAQFCCTSLWFAGNAVMSDLVRSFNLPPQALGHLTSAVQFGFIIGTLTFAILTIADRFSPSRVFFVCALAGALFNLKAALGNNNFITLFLFRILTGFSLAGIYPVGMKIAADHFQKGLGRSLGFLVGALVIGTAFPHLLKAISGNAALDWRLVLIFTSGFAVAGGTMILSLVPDGPYRSPLQKPDLTALLRMFKKREFRAAAFGYFGHMWELYAFWVFVPALLSSYKLLHRDTNFNIPLISFLVIGVGGIACIVGGFIAERFGTKSTAVSALFLSGLCCLLSPLVFLFTSEEFFIIFLLFWGLTAVADSPLFSTLIAQNAPAQSRGTALTIVNSAGFAITIVSIQLLNLLNELYSSIFLLTILALGPALGLLAMFRKRTKSNHFANSVST